MAYVYKADPEADRLHNEKLAAKKRQQEIDMQNQQERFKNHPVSTSFEYLTIDCLQLNPLKIEADMRYKELGNDFVPSEQYQKYNHQFGSAGVQNLNIPQVSVQDEDDSLHTSNLSACQSYASNETAAAHKNAKYRYLDEGKDYVQMTEKALARHTIGNGQVSTQLKCI